jgi:hypothetical protein
MEVADLLQDERATRTRVVPVDVRGALAATALALLLFAVGPIRRLPAHRRWLLKLLRMSSAGHKLSPVGDTPVASRRQTFSRT